MAKLKIKDLPKDLKVSEDQLKRIKGGLLLRPALSIGGAPSLRQSGLVKFGPIATSGGKLLGNLGGILSR